MTVNMESEGIKSGAPEQIYFRADQVQPGKIYVACRGEEMFLVLGVDPAMQGDTTAVLILKRLLGSAFSSDFLIIDGRIFADNSRFMEIVGCRFQASLDVTLWRRTQGSPNIGSLYRSETALMLVAMDRSGQKFIVDVGTGEIKSSFSGTLFWTSEWSIDQKNANGLWQSVFHRQ